MPKKTLGFYGVICALLCAAPAGATTCAAGQYLSDGSCLPCNPHSEPYYCPGDDIRYPCPVTDTDYDALSGMTTIGRSEATWAQNFASAPQDCHGDLEFIDAHQNHALVECNWNGEHYLGCQNYLWSAAGPGYYLSPYRYSTHRPWYKGAKPCTNAPAHAHYTGPGTPDSPDGTITDANDCPWECDEGYGRVGAVCEPLCAIGITHIRAGDATAPLFPTRHSTPALVVQTAGGLCYGNLTAGTGAGVNIRVAETTYHLD